MSDLDELYQEVILDHNKSPRNYRVMSDANRKAEGYNPLCGDHVTVYLHLEDGVIRDVSFQGSGCAISKASASMMTASCWRPKCALVLKSTRMLTARTIMSRLRIDKLAALARPRIPVLHKCASPAGTR
jgi:nitrogen fixation NifU-like protein